MKTFELIPFYHFEKELRVSVSESFEFKLAGNAKLVKVPDVSKSPAKIDGLYNTTCFEIFAANVKGEYIEWNFSPSGDWCVFSFESYRKKCIDKAGKETFSLNSFTSNSKESIFTVSLDFEQVKRVLKVNDKLQIACTAVIEFISGKKDYYALAHPSQKPDFHDLKGFLMER